MEDGLSALADFYPALLIAAVFLVAALAAAPFVHRLGLPEPAAFLGVGIVAGAVGIQPLGDLSPLQLQQVGTIALYVILFQGGLSTGWTAWRREARSILVLGLPGTAATAGALALAGVALGLPWELAVLCGVALAPTDPAAVYAVLRGRADSRARTILEGESGFNDPVGIAFMVVAVAAFGADGATVGDGALRLAKELGFGVVGGAVGAVVTLGALRVTRHLDDALEAVALLAIAIAVAAATATLHGSGFLAIYITGLLAADRWAKHDGRQHAVPQSVAALGEPVLFGLLGAAAAPLVGWDDVWLGAAFTVVTVLVVRAVVVAICTAGVGLGRMEQAIVWSGGLKGAVPLLLATLPALALLDDSDRVRAIVLVATVASIVLQGTLLRLIAARSD